MSEPVAAGHETRAHILAAMLGISLTFAIEQGKENRFDLAWRLAFPALVIQAVIFTVGMINMSQDDHYQAVLKKGEYRLKAIYDLWSDIATGVLLALMAFKLDDAWNFLFLNLAFRGVDLVAECLVVNPVTREMNRRKAKSACTSEEKHADGNSWLRIDLFAVFVFVVSGLVVWWFNAWDDWGKPVIAGAFLGSTLILALVDMSINGAFYVGNVGERNRHPKVW